MASAEEPRTENRESLAPPTQIQSRLSPAELRELLERDLPGAIALPSADGDTQVKGMLATDDVLVVATQIPAVLRYMRDQQGYVYLSNITAVDFIDAGIFELVYHLYQLEGGPALVIKTRVPRDTPVVPSISSFWQGAQLQEREAYDLFGVDFPGHPDLRRVYMWDEFEGFPMRKDFPKQGDKYLDDE